MFYAFFGGFDPGEGFFYCIKISRNIDLSSNTGINQRIQKVYEDMNALAQNQAELVVGTQTAATAAWTGVSTLSAFRIFHAGMATPVPIANGGTGASSAANARGNIGANNAYNLTTGAVPGTVCITDSFQRQIVAADITMKFQKPPFQ